MKKKGKSKASCKRCRWASNPSSPSLEMSKVRRSPVCGVHTSDRVGSHAHTHLHKRNAPISSSCGLLGTHPDEYMQYASISCAWFAG